MSLPTTPTAVFDFHMDVRNLPRLTPVRARIVSAPRPTREGDLQVIEIGVWPLAVRWHARITTVEPPLRLVDVQERGPFRYWRHTHAVIADGVGAVLVDIVEFRFFPGWFGRPIDATIVAAGMRLMFMNRHRRTRRLLVSRRGGR
ncbi:MAG: SRPBCC family protein [Dehalococcoidia bacterium]